MDSVDVTVRIIELLNPFLVGFTDQGTAIDFLYALDDVNQLLEEFKSEK